LKGAGAGLDEDAAGFVLAGGQSRRMGAEKSLVEIGGRPLIAHAVGILAAAGLPVFIAGAREEARSRLEPYAPVIPDHEPGLGPLGGICTALAATTAEYGVFLPVDVPLLPSSLVAYLIRHAAISEAAVTLASVNGFAQTFPAVISRRALAALERELEGRRLGCLASFEAAAVELGESMSVIAAEVLVQAGQVSHPEALPVVRWFLNLNTEQDLRLASSRRATRVI
jgi:molybdopterin-guanine dinucleotide biosynthesis protein A